MNTLKFYTPDGKEIEKEDFISLYGKSYYIGESCLVRGIVQSSEYVEKEIEAILKNGIKKETDVIRILAWKIGKIKHSESEKQKNFTYAADWSDAENFNIMRYKESFHLKPFAQYIVSNINELEGRVKTMLQEVLQELKEQAPAGIGGVYLITLIYFLSKGYYPIYDRFAHVAVKALYMDENPKDIYVGNAPGKDDLAKVMAMYKEYCWLLKHVFGTYSIERKLDQALWVYGHGAITVKHDNSTDRVYMSEIFQS